MALGIGFIVPKGEIHQLHFVAIVGFDPAMKSTAAIPEKTVIVQQLDEVAVAGIDDGDPCDWNVRAVQ